MWEKRGQAELEQAFAAYCRHVREDMKGTINAALAPEFLCCDGARNTYTIAYRTEDWMRNPNGVTHGGLIASMLDNAMGVMAHVHAPGKLTATVSLEVSYVLPVPVGRQVHIEVAISRIGGTIAHTTGRLYDAEQPDTTLATAAGVYHLGGR